ncbi:hypothetical protein B484DRAFT_450806 [Ochromonadaceae sp. CCMP2298]|nr:hypothetical protein B484DRAFT_450806 [Ochromonadaceae sp. CCMP2298]|mmetsp:Transcript_32152/g.71476  ORF Transcript_32152/g.71476 Transcript_32152/m.71476 type:complete len:303 (+) Transcript_32152:145-1053(+)
MFSAPRRLLSSLLQGDGDGGTTQPWHRRGFEYLAARSGISVKYVIYASMLLTLALFALLASVNEIAASGPRPPAHVDTLSPVEDMSMHSLRGNVVGNGTVAHLTARSRAHSHSSSSAGSSSTGLSSWFSIVLSLVTWVFLVVVLRYLRYAQGRAVGRVFAGSGGSAGGNRESARMLAQMMGMRGGLSNRMRLALLNRDFNGDDYEMLQQLDEHAVMPPHQGADDAQIERLPLHHITAQEVRENEAGAASAGGASTCTICLGPYEEGEAVRTVRCLHRFHRDCIDPWLRANATCPICKYYAVE